MERRRAPSAWRTSAGGGDPLQQVWEAPRSLGSASGGRQRSRGLAASMTVTGSRLGPASGMHGRRALGRRVACATEPGLESAPSAGPVDMHVWAVDGSRGASHLYVSSAQIMAQNVNSTVEFS